MAQKKEKKNRKRKKKRYFLVFPGIIAAAVLLYFFFSSSLFDIKAIEVTGNDHHTAGEIIDMAGAELGVPIFKIDKKDMTASLKEDPYIKEIKIGRRLPSTLTIEVIERKEAAAVAYGNSFILIDPDCIILRRVDEQPEVPLLVGLTILNMQPGESFKAEQVNVLENTMALLKAMDSNGLYFKKIDISDVIVKAYIYDNLVCQGKPENILEAMNNGNLEAVLVDLMEENIKRGTINLGGNGYCSFSPEII